MAAIGLYLRNVLHGRRLLRQGKVARHQAFTLIELLVVIGIIGVLIALLLPAIQMARESARKAQCQNNLRQLGIAFHLHEDSLGAFPAGFHTVAPTGTFVRNLLPFIEQANLNYDIQLNWDDPANRTAVTTVLPILVCPSSPAAKRYDAARNDFRPAAGDYTGTHGVNHGYCLQAGWPVFTPPDLNGTMTSLPCRMSEITDGTTHTFLLIEDAGRPDLWRTKHLASGASSDAGWADPEYETALDGSDRNLTGSGQYGGLCVMNCTNDNEAYSFHPTGVHFLMADGSVQFLTESIDNRIYAALTTKANADDANLP